MGDKSKAHYYYKRANQLAIKEIAKPFDLEAEFGVKTEKEFHKMAKSINSEATLEELKTAELNEKKLLLYLTVIALGEDKFDELNNLAKLQFSFIEEMEHYKINTRNDIFKLVTGWELSED